MCWRGPGHMSVRNLPLVPEHIQKINTPRRPSNTQLMDEHNARSDVLVGLARSTAIETAKETTEAEFAAMRERVGLMVAANLDQMRAESRELAKRMVTAHDFASQSRNVASALSSLEEQVGRLTKERDLHALALAEVRTSLENIVPVLEGMHRTMLENPPVPVPVQFTPLEWVLIILSFGLYRPTKNPP